MTKSGDPTCRASGKRAISTVHPDLWLSVRVSLAFSLPCSTNEAFPHHHVVVLERGPFPSGASVKNAGFACFGSPSELLADLYNEGTDAMLYRVEERWHGLLELRKELGDATIGFESTRRT